jgi:predicted ATPase
VTPILAREVDRVLTERVYQPRVFFVHLLGFITPTAARRISSAQSIRFERFHERAYRDHGFELIDVSAGTLDERMRLIDGCLRSWAG